MKVELEPHYDAIVVLGAKMEWKERKLFTAGQSVIVGEWRFPTIFRDDLGKVSAGNVTAAAAGCVYSMGLTESLLITGGIEESKGHVGSRSEELSKLIARKYKVPEGNLMVIGKRGNTPGNVQDTIDYLKENPDIEIKKLGILSNEWHLPRAMDSFKKEKFFEEHGISLFSVPDEVILKKISRHYEWWLKKLSRSPAMLERRFVEFTGKMLVKLNVYDRAFDLAYKLGIHR